MPDPEITHPRGRKVVFLNKNGWPSDAPHAVKAGLVEGETYLVKRLEVGNWCSHYALEGIEGLHNTVMFKEADAKSVSTDCRLCSPDSHCNGACHGVWPDGTPRDAKVQQGYVSIAPPAPPRPPAVASKTLYALLYPEMEEFAKENGFKFTMAEWPLICRLQEKLAKKNKMSLIWSSEPHIL